MSNSEQSLSAMDRWVVHYTETILQRYGMVLLVSLVLSVLAGYGMLRLGYNNDYQYFFSEENPQLRTFNDIEDIYSKNDNVMIVLEVPEGKVFTIETLKAVEDLTARAWLLPYARRVDSITNFQHSEAVGDDIRVAELFDSGSSNLAAVVERAHHIAVREPVLLNRLITTNANVTGINVTLDLPDGDPSSESQVISAVRGLVADWEADHEGYHIYLSGMAPLANAFSENARKDITHLVPLMYLGILLVLYFMLRSLSGTFATFLVILLSVVTGMGLSGWFGIPITAPSSTAPTIITTLAVADSIHILVSLLTLMRGGMPKREAIVESMRLNFQPVFLTSLTTCVGFLSMNFSDAPPFRDLGNITAMGVAAAFFLSVTLLPALLHLLPMHVRVKPSRSDNRLTGLAEFVIRRRKVLLCGGLLLVLALAALVPSNDLNERFVQYFGKRIEFRQHADFTMQNLTGVYSIEYSLNSGDSGGVQDPAYLNIVDNFAAYWRKRPGVVHVNAFSDTIKKLHRNFNADDPEFYGIPTNRFLIAQYVLLYENSLPQGLDINNQINIDKSSTRFTIVLEDLSTRELRDMAHAGEHWLKQNAPEHMFAYGVSPTMMFAYISERNLFSMLVGTAVALVVISLILMFALRSFTYGVISLLPNLAPAVMSFGLWALVDGQVTMALAVVTAMSLGIVVDDTVHFLSKFIRARREKRLGANDAVRYAFRSVGMALITTSAILVAGFAILSMSAFELNGGMGRLTAIAIMMALVADFFILPPLLIAVTDRDAPPERAVTSEWQPVSK